MDNRGKTAFAIANKDKIPRNKLEEQLCEQNFKSLVNANEELSK